MRVPALLLATMLMLTLSPAWAQTGETRVPLTAGTVAPDFIATTLEAATVSLAEMHGKAVVLNFFITWYRDAAEHLHMMEDLNSAFGEQGMRLVSVSLDAGERGLEDVRTLIRDEEIAHPIVSDPQQVVAALYGVRALPAIFIIGRDGVIAHYHEGYTEGDDERLGALIAAALAAESPPETVVAAGAPAEGTAPTEPTAGVEPAAEPEPTPAAQPSTGVEEPSEPVCKCFRREER